MQETIMEDFFVAGIPVYMDWLKNHRMGLSYELLPCENSPLRIAENGTEYTLWVRCDSQMGAYVASHHKWEPEKPTFFQTLTLEKFNNLNVTLVDIGANVGLFIVHVQS